MGNAIGIKKEDEKEVVARSAVAAISEQFGVSGKEANSFLKGPLPRFPIAGDRMVATTLQALAAHLKRKETKMEIAIKIMTYVINAMIQTRKWRPTRAEISNAFHYEPYLVAMLNTSKRVARSCSFRSTNHH